MSEKKKKKTKITSGAPAGQADNAAAVQHGKKERDEAKSMDEKHGSHAQDSGKKAEEGRKGGLGESIKDTAKFLNEVKNEGRKITWPPRRQVLQETWSVMVLVTIITIMVLGFDYALGNWIFGPIEHFAKVLAPSEQMAIPTEIPGAPMPPPDGTAPGAPAPATPPPGSAAPAPTQGTVPAPTAPGAPTSAPAATPPVTATPAPPAASTPAPQAPPTKP